VLPVTGNFSSRAPLGDFAREALLAACEDGWADPLKISQASARAAILQNHCLESISSHLSLSIDQIEILGEVNLGHFLAVGGLLHSDSHLILGATDRSEIFATSQNHTGPVSVIPVNQSGQFEKIEIEKLVTPASVAALALANAETGIIQRLGSPEFNSIQGAIDATTTGTRIPLPPFWESALFDASSWGGPCGIGILAIRNEEQWKNPLPHISSSRVPQSYSLPLLVSAAVALENFEPESDRIRELTQGLRTRISQSVEDCDIAGELHESLEHITSFSFLYCEGEELLRKLSERGFSVDSGSACTSMNLQPSHVLAAMGVLTHGNVRVTIHPGTSETDVHLLGSAIIESVKEMRGDA
jgi:cysteine desulfurase